jgi:hypothetical protein
VELEDPDVTDISYFDFEYIQKAIGLSFSGIPTHKLTSIREKLFHVLKKHFEEGVDMKRMALVIDRFRLKVLEAVETDPAGFFVKYALNFLYSIHVLFNKLNRGKSKNLQIAE